MARQLSVTSVTDLPPVTREETDGLVPWTDSPIS